jgi:hypothetical protein
METLKLKFIKRLAEGLVAIAFILGIILISILLESHKL